MSTDEHHDERNSVIIKSVIAAIYVVVLMLLIPCICFLSTLVMHLTQNTSIVAMTMVAIFVLMFFISKIPAIKKMNQLVDSVLGGTSSSTPKAKNFNPQAKSSSIIAGEPIATLGELREKLRPWLRSAAQIVAEPATEPSNSAMLSHFGGQPYFEKGDKWPQDSDGNPMYFVFQYFNDGTLPIPKDIKLVQFFFSTQRKFESDNFVKVWHELSPKKAIKIPPPDVQIPTHAEETDFWGKENDMSLQVSLSEIMSYQAITFRPIKSMPCSMTMSNLLAGEKWLDHTEIDLSYDDYDAVAGSLTGEDETKIIEPPHDHVGGWAEFYQDDMYSYPVGGKKNSDATYDAKIYERRQDLTLLFWKDWWGDQSKLYEDFMHADGCGYILYDPKTKKATYAEDGT
jgi:hypothetical protein